MENQVTKPTELNYVEFKQELYQLLIRANQERGLSYTIMEPVVADFFKQIQDASKEEISHAQKLYKEALENQSASVTPEIPCTTSEHITCENTTVEPEVKSVTTTAQTTVKKDKKAK